MFGFIIGTACLIGLITTLRRGHGWHGWHGWHGHHGYGRGCGGGYGYGRGFDGCGPGAGYGGPYGGPYRDHGHHDHDHDHGRRGRGGWGFRGFRGFGPRAVIDHVLARLDATPAQERAIYAAIDEFRQTAKAQRGELEESRKDVAKALRADSFDAVLLGDTFGRQDTKIEEVRKAFVGALSKIHDALDDRQRRILAELVEGGIWS